MEPVRDMDYKLVDILNALLDTGVIINADVVITVSGIPLIGINLRAALAGMATMLDYGLMEAWDESIRKYYAKEIEDRKLPIKNMVASSIVPQHNFPTELMQSSFENEKLIQKEKLWYLSSASDIIGETWLPGYMHVTDEKVYWTYQLNGKILFDMPVKKVITIEVDETKTYITRIPTKNKILKISYKDLDSEATVLFSGEEIKIKRIKSAIENVNNSLMNHFDTI